jgi:hypothetical protein
MEPTTISDSLDLCYSPDDGGFYFQDYSPPSNGEKTSQIFPTQEEAIAAYRANALIWE